MTVQQLVRDLLSKAIKEGLVSQVEDPQTATSGDLVALTNMINQ